MPFQPGQSGNPGGRPKASARVRDAAREHTESAIDVLVSIMTNTDAATAARVAAASAILDRGYGKPTQPIDGDGDGGPISNNIIVSFVDGPGE